MQIIKTISFLIVFISFQAFGQEASVKISDFNGDGIPDTLKSFYQGESGFGGKFCEVTNGKTKEIYELNTWGSFCQIKKCIIIPPALNKVENFKFLEAMNKEILPNKKNKPDASLQWIINSTFSNKILTNNKYFDLVIFNHSLWNDEKLQLPSTYYIYLEGDSLNKFYDTVEAPDWFNKNESKGYLIYYGHNHYRNPSKDSLLLIDSNINYEVYRTSHGVLIKKDKLFKWVFISDAELTGAPEKLRWESIKRVQLIDNYIIIQQCLPPTDDYNLYLVNIESGICGKLKFDFYNKESIIPEKDNTFLIQSDTIIFSIKGKQTQFELTDIFKELDAQNTK